jgi:hypothetical protein
MATVKGIKLIFRQYRLLCLSIKLKDKETKRVKKSGVMRAM